MYIGTEADSTSIVGPNSRFSVYSQHTIAFRVFHLHCLIIHLEQRFNSDILYYCTQHYGPLMKPHKNIKCLNALEKILKLRKQNVEFVRHENKGLRESLVFLFKVICVVGISDLNEPN